VNILGLTIGLASVLILILWISIELRFDTFHKDKDRLYRVAMIMKTPNKEINQAQINAPAGPEFKREFPVVENMVRLVDDNKSVIYNDRTIRLKILYTDSTFFDMFSFDLLTGNRKECLNSPLGIVLTQTSAKRIFGTEDPLGKGILISGRTFNVTAIAKDPPVYTNLQFDCLVPFSVVASTMHIGWDGGLSCFTYLRLVKGADPRILEKQIMDYMEVVINKKYREYGFALNPYLQNIGDIHLHSEADYELGNKGSLKQVFLFSGIGILILLIACFNFVNISTALSFKRAKEISVKKIFGSDRKNIILYFILESAIAILISIFLAFILVKILIPLATDLIGENLSLTLLKPLTFMLISVLIFIFCTVFASFYSSVYLSSINPLELLSKVNSGKRKQYSRNLLVTFQYTISIALIISCIVIYLQMQYVNNSDKGFNEKNILLVDLNSKTASSYEMILSKLAALPGITSLSVSAGGSPGVGFFMNGYVPQGLTKPMLARALYVDENYLKTMDIGLVSGRDFKNLKIDRNKTIINQTFVNLLGWNDPVGKTISRNGTTYEVIGVVRDFNTSSLYNKTEPIFISTVNEVEEFEKIVIRYQPSNLKDVLKSVESITREINPNFPFEYMFLEDAMRDSYSKDHKMNLLFLALSVIAIFISSLGLFGLATFATQSRIKEISIRKINGATIADVFTKFNFELLKWILISFVIAAPIGYFVMNKFWLSNFAYKITISIWLLILSGLFALSIGLITVSWAATKAALTNPTQTLRTE
jgi:putative ABC transport system permease protein